MAVAVAIPDLKVALIDRMPDVARVLLPGGRRIGPEWVIGSLQGDRGRSLSIRIRGSKAGVWEDFATGEKGGVWELIMAVNGGKFTDALQWAFSFLGKDPPRGCSREQSDEDARRTDLAREIWEAASQLAGTEGERYLRSRGLNQCGRLRFVAELKHSPEFTGPALVAPIEDSTGVFRAIHRIWINPDLQPRKKALGPCSGNLVRLMAPVSPTIGIAEGIETALAANILFPSLPVWAAIGTSGMAYARIPLEVREVVILADADNPGREAARKLADRITKSGRVTEIREAPGREGTDWNDVLREEWGL